MSEVVRTETVAVVRVDVKAAVRDATYGYRMSMKEATRNVRANVRAVQKLIGAGLVTAEEVARFCNWRCPYFKVGVADLPRWRRALGVPLKMEWKDVEDAAERTVCVTLSVKNEKGLNMRLKYVKKLPEGSRCRIVEVQSVSHQIVCDRE